MRHAGVWRAFDLSARGYFLDFALLPLAIGALVCFCGTGPVGIAAGFAAWTLAEYWIHRLIFHGHTPFEPMHQMHHALPKDTFAGFAAIWLLFGASFCTGFMLGYLAYCAIHVRMHHGNRANFSRYVAFMFDHHAGHHRGGQGNFGVTSPIWDFVFRTFKT
jgi:sterol desaturase/sphingolipid hydroxylase (fatty acid hydroxylase superfamily)